MAAYCKRMAKFPINSPLDLKMSLVLSSRSFELMLWHCPNKHTRCALMDKKAMLRQQGRLLQQASCVIGRQIASGLKGNQKQCVATAAENIEGQLAGGEPKEAWHCFEGWYKAASECAPTASPMSLAFQTAKRVALYGRVSPPGAPIPIHINKANILIVIPSDGELQAVVWDLQNRCTADAMGLQTKHIRVCLCNIVCVCVCVCVSV
jgi:hypothetical protein